MTIDWARDDERRQSFTEYEGLPVDEKMGAKLEKDDDPVMSVNQPT